MSEERAIRGPYFKYFDRVTVLVTEKMKPERGDAITGTIMGIQANRRRGFVYQVLAD